MEHASLCALLPSPMLLDTRLEHNGAISRASDLPCIPYAYLGYTKLFKLPRTEVALHVASLSRRAAICKLRVCQWHACVIACT